MGLREWLDRVAEVKDIRMEQETAKQQGSSMHQARLTPQQERDLRDAMKRQSQRTWREA